MTDTTVLDGDALLVGGDDHRGGEAARSRPPARVLSAISAGTMGEILQSAGYRIDVLAGDGITILRSATGGLGFDIRLMNPAAGGDHYADVTFLTHFAVEGRFPPELLNRWNKSRRFGRLFLDHAQTGSEFLVLSLDFSLAGGVSPDHVRAYIEIWDFLVHQLCGWLREELPKIAPAVADAATSGLAPVGSASAQT